MRRPTPNAIVGFAALVGFLLFLLFTLLIRGSLFGARMELNVLYQRVSGLEVGSPVYVAGVYAGEVSKISYLPDRTENPVVVTLRLNRSFHFYRNASVDIVQAGIIGDKRVEIDPGTSDMDRLPYGEALVGKPQFDIDRSLREAQQIVSDLAASVASLRQLITDEANLGAIRSTLHSLEESIDNMNRMMAENRENLLVTSTNLRQASETANRVLTKTEGLVDGAEEDLQVTRESIESVLNNLQEETTRAGDNLQTVTEQLSGTLEEARELVKVTRTRIEPTLTNLEEASESLSAVMGGVKEGEGTLGQLATNPSPFVELDRTLRAIRQAIVGGTGFEAGVQYEETGGPEPAAAPGSPSPGASQP